MLNQVYNLRLAIIDIDDQWELALWDGISRTKKLLATQMMFRCPHYLGQKHLTALFKDQIKGIAGKIQLLNIDLKQTDKKGFPHQSTTKISNQ